MAIFTEAARTALRKCMGRQPGEGVTLTDDEIRGLFDWLTVMGRQDAIDYVEAAQVVMGVGEAEYLAAVNNTRTLRAQVDAMRAVVEAAKPIGRTRLYSKNGMVEVYAWAHANLFECIEALEKVTKP